MFDLTKMPPMNALPDEVLAQLNEFYMWSNP
jgi:hypothetical protein